MKVADVIEVLSAWGKLNYTCSHVPPSVYSSRRQADSFFKS